MSSPGGRDLKFSLYFCSTFMAPFLSSLEASTGTDSGTKKATTAPSPIGMADRPTYQCQPKLIITPVWSCS